LPFACLLFFQDREEEEKSEERRERGRGEKMASLNFKQGDLIAFGNAAAGQ
jgi:hypothetical protein